VSYFGSSDLYWAGTQDVSNLSGLTMKTVIKDKNGSICGEEEEIIDDITDGQLKNKEVEIILDKKCKEMFYSVSLSSGQKSLAEQSGNLPKIVNNQKNLQYLYFGAPAFLMLLAFYFFIRKKSVPVYFFIFAIAGIAMFSGMALAVEKRIYPASGGNAYAIEWGGEWVNDGSAVLYSTAERTGGLNKLKPNYVNAQLANFFVNNTNTGDVVINYNTDDTSCVNTSMEVDYQVFMSANGEEDLLTEAHILYNSGTGTYYQNVPIPSDKINWLYNNDGTPKANPKLIVNMKQIGIYEITEEFTETYEYVGWGEGTYAYDGETGVYYLSDGGDYNLVKTANVSFYPGIFTQNQSEKTTKSNAYELSDIIRIEIPLTLPAPTLRIDPPTATLNPGETKQFKVFYDADGPNYTSQEEDVTAKINLGGLNNWSSDKTSVVKITETGVVEAVASGSTTVKAVYYRGLNAKAQIYVPSLRIDPASVTTMSVNTKKQFNAFYNVYDGLGETKITSDKKTDWASSEWSVAGFGNAQGRVFANGKGMADISVSYKRLIETVSVIVESGLIVNCSVDKTNAKVNDSIVFTAYPEGGTAPHSYLWTGDVSGSLSSIVSSFATVGEKIAVIEVKDNSGKTATNSCSVVVEENNPADPSYNISPDGANVYVNNTRQFTGSYNSDETGTSADVFDVTNSASWTSSDTNIATVVTVGISGRGVATCLKPNEKEITITSTYTDKNKETFTDTALLSCLPIDPPPVPLTVNIIGKGKVDGLVNCENLTGNKKTCVGQLEKYDTGYLRATSATGYTFSPSGWSGSCSNSLKNVFVSNGDDDYSEGDYVCDPLVVDVNKEVTASFTKDTAFPTAYISADKTNLAVGEEAVLSWGSDNATSCVNDDNDADSGWADTNQKNDINGNYKTKVFGQEEERIYSVTCFDNFENEDSASITISSSSDEPETPAVDFWNTPDIVDFGEQANLSWLSENTKSCEISSDDDSSFKGSNKGTNLMSNGDLQTGNLNKESSKYVYTIKCLGDDGSYAEDQTVVETKEKPCGSDCVTKGEIIITIADYIEANIVAGLPANSTKEDLNITSTNCTDSIYTLDFDYNGVWDIYFGDEKITQATERSLSDFGKLSARNISGKTPAGKYPITTTATCIDADDESKTITANRIIYLIVKRIDSLWQEL